jgi:hypothetical protein
MNESSKIEKSDIASNSGCKFLCIPNIGHGMKIEQQRGDVVILTPAKRVVL